MNAGSFVDQLSQFSIPGVFNPYRHVCPRHDCPDAPAIRRKNLQLYLEYAARTGIESVWLGRDLGYRGGRRTGIALTDELNLRSLEMYIGVAGFTRATTGEPVAERTATEIWKILSTIDAAVFLWNVFPFHPHGDDDPLSNRRHTSREFAVCQELLVSLLQYLKPSITVALGRDAFNEATRIGVSAVLVRHPSYGGHKEFTKSIRSIYGNSRSPRPA